MAQPFSVIGLAHAQASGGAPQGPGLLPNVILFGALILIFYFLLIRPQQKRMKQHREMVQNLDKGDEVVTGGGFYGRVVRVNEDTITVELAEGVRVKAQRDSIQNVLPKGTLKD